MKFTKKPLNTFNKLSKKSTKFIKRNLRKIFKGGKNYDDFQKELKCVAGTIDKHNTADFYKIMRDELLFQGGLSKIKAWLVANNLAMENSDDLLTTVNFKNVFVVKANANENTIKALQLSEIETNHNKYIDNKNFVLSFNLPINDKYWETDKVVNKDGKIQSPGTASMSKHHRFLIIKDTTIRHFNVLTFGMDDNGIKPDLLQKDIDLLNEMKKKALLYVDKARENNEWSEGTHHNDVGLYFHCFPFNSVQSLHLHIVDLNNVGPSFYVHQHKNLPIDEVIKVLKNELHSQAVSLYKPRPPPNERGFETDTWGGKKHTRKLHKIKRRKNNTRRRRKH